MPDVTGIASALRSEATGFVGGGVTSGKIPEFLIQNQPIQDFMFDLEAVSGVVPAAVP